MKFVDFLSPKSIVPQLQSTERNDVIREMVEAVVQAGEVPAELKDELVKAIIAREKQGSTGFGKGVAVPHVKHEKVLKMAAVVGVSQKGVDFNALDKAPVYSVVMLISPKDKPEEHLEAMQSLFRYLENDLFRKFLRQATTADEVIDLLHEADAQQLRG